MKTSHNWPNLWKPGLRKSMTGSKIRDCNCHKWLRWMITARCAPQKMETGTLKLGILSVMPIWILAFNLIDQIWPSSQGFSAMIVGSITSILTKSPHPPQTWIPKASDSSISLENQLIYSNLQRIAHMFWPKTTKRPSPNRWDTATPTKMTSRPITKRPSTESYPANP